MGKIEDFMAKYPQAAQTGATPTSATPVRPSPASKPKPKTAQNTVNAAQTPKPQKKDKMTQKQDTPRFNNELPQEVAKDLHDYLYTSADDYSDAVADYIDAEDKSPREKISHTLNILDYMRDEFKKRPDAQAPNPQRVDRRKLTEMAVGLYYIHKGAPKVAAKVEKFLTRIAEVSARDYVRGGKDSFLNNLLAAYEKHAPKNDKALIWDTLCEQHINGVFDKLEKQENKSNDDILKDKLKYARFLRRKEFDKAFESYIPDELLEALEEAKKKKSDNTKQPTDKKSEPKTGDKPMTDEIKDTTASADVEDTDKKDEKKNEEHTFVPSGIQKWACLYANEDYKRFKNEQELQDALSSKGVLIQGNNVIDLNMESVVHTFSPKTEEEVKAQEAKKYMERDDGLDPSDLPSKEEKKEPEPTPVTVNAMDPVNENEEEKEEPEQPLDWVQKKIRDYKAMETEGKISNVVIKEDLKTEFEAQVDGGTIHYSSPDNVSISNDAKIKTFEAVMMEPDNLGRPINFGENMPHDMAVRLVAACVLHGNKMQGNVPELTAEDLQMLQSELGDRFGDFQKKLAEMTKPKEERTGEEKPTEEKPSEEKPMEEKVKLTTAEELGKAAESLKGIKEQFEQMKNDGLIAVTTNLETKKPEIVAGPAFDDPTSAEAKKVVDDANALIASAAAIVKSSKTVSGKLNEEQAKQNNEFNQERLEHLRKTMDQKKLAEHDAMTPEARAARLAEMREDMSVKLGITTDPKGEKKALTDQELTDYISQGKVTIKNYADLWEKANEGKKFDIKELKPEEKAVFMQISKTQLDRRNALMGKDTSRDK